MGKFWKRKAEVITHGQSYKSDEFDIDFNVDFDDNPEPNVAEISIWNLTVSTRNKFKTGDKLVLNAGYEGDVGAIVEGEIADIEEKGSKLEVELRLYVATGAGSWGKEEVNMDFPEGTTNLSVIKALAGKTGLSVDKVEIAEDVVYSSGKTVNGLVSSELIDLCLEARSKLIIEKGALNIAPYSKNLDKLTVLNPDTGLIGSPEKITLRQDDETGSIDGYRVQMLLNYTIQAGSTLKLESNRVGGNFIVIEGNHSNHITEVEVVEL